MKFISIPKDMAMPKIIITNKNKNFILNICLSKISYSDYASAMIDIVLNSCYENTLIGVISL